MTNTKTVEAGERTQHTPGPWTIGAYPESKDGFRYTISRNGRGWWIAAVTNGPAEEQSANARLIAAAPELLEELRQLADYVEQYHNTVDANGYLESARAAIAKAEGKE